MAEITVFMKLQKKNDKTVLTHFVDIDRFKIEILLDIELFHVMLFETALHLFLIGVNS